jgi:hypothetical protein
MRPKHLVILLALAACGQEEGDPLRRLEPTGELTLSPGNLGGQDEDPSPLIAGDGSLYVAWYSNRNGPDVREIFLARSSDGRVWTDPPIQVTRSPQFSFYPSMVQDAAGAFHLAWWRVIPISGGGTTNRVLYKSSPDGVSWDLDREITVADGPGDWLPSLVHDRVGNRLLVYFVSPVRDAAGQVDLGERVSRIYVAIDAGAGFGPPQRLVGVNPDDSHNTYPHVVQRQDGRFLMTWTRYDASAPNDVLQVLAEPSTQTLFSTSTDGLAWSPPAVMSDPAAVDVLPHLYPEQDGPTWRVVWQTASASAPTGATVEMVADGVYPDDLVPRPEIVGYSSFVLPTATPDIYWGVWVNGAAGRQKIRYEFFRR